ncbi:hypothetical protein [Paenibacillus eucommiae]|uniref:Uncharacterized protein n=1 Tax=Paenibacillus eucommiae TaxID=1355755 RepID=A0ABS4IRN5_9BACL|nr:hypothetical protein [Paenibacillus eucommiae]MBP1990200.1 hypothetical protein [Paenibacillus eucommiae]
MTYTIIVTQVDEYLFDAVVKVMEGETLLLEGETSVGCETETEAYEYAEKVFLPDLRRNYPRLIGDLVFPWEVADDDPIEAE